MQTRRAHRLIRHSILADVGPCKHWLVSVPAFFRAATLPELWSCRTALRHRRLKGPDRSGGFHVGVRVFCISRSRDLPDHSTSGERSSRDEKTELGRARALAQ